MSVVCFMSALKQILEENVRGEVCLCLMRSLSVIVRRLLQD